MDAELTEAVLRAGRSAGLAAVGITTVARLEPAWSVLPTRRQAGLAASMQFTYRNPERSTDPVASSLGSARSMVAGAWDYRRRGQEPDSTGAPHGRIARYAWRDHYADLRAALEQTGEVLRTAGYRTVVKADDNALVDRNVAWRAGLGWYGKNANLLIPGIGSWVVLGAIVTDAPLAPNPEPLADACGTCRRCFDGCPTGAIVAPGIVDAGRCLAWLVQGPDPIPVEFREALGDRLYGCDDCQDVCPPARFDDGPAAELDSEPSVDLHWLLRAGDAELLERLGRFYLANRDPDVLRRTALVVLGNTADPADRASRAILTRYAGDANPVLAEHARWAIDRLDRRAAPAAPAPA